MYFSFNAKKRNVQFSHNDFYKSLAMSYTNELYIVFTGNKITNSLHILFFVLGHHIQPLYRPALSTASQQMSSVSSSHHQTQQRTSTNSGGQRRSTAENNHAVSSPAPRTLRSKILRCFAKKYILLCLLCGGCCLTLGILYLVIFFLLGRYTTSLHYFQTLPTYIPAVVVSPIFVKQRKYSIGHYGNSPAVCYVLKQLFSLLENGLCRIKLHIIKVCKNGTDKFEFLLA